jgi:hypothetical protein
MAAPVGMGELCQARLVGAANAPPTRPSSTMACGEIVLRLHFNQAAGGALEFELQALAVIERAGGAAADTTIFTPRS